MEIDDEKYTDEDLGICVAYEELEQMTNNFKYILIPIIVCYLILLTVKSTAP